LGECCSPRRQACGHPGLDARSSCLSRIASASRSTRWSASAARSANTISPGNINNRRRRWAAGSSKRNGSSYYGDKDRPERFDRIVQSWDTANKATELSDFSVCTTWGIKGKDLYLLSVLRRQLEYPNLKRAVREQQRLFNANVVLIEDKASGTQLIQELILDGCSAVTKYKPECDKVMRLHAQTALIENGFVYIPQTAPWLAKYLHEMTVFPRGKHDDQVDSTAQFLDWFKKPMPSWGIYEATRWQAEALSAGRRGERVEPRLAENHLIEIYRKARADYDSGQDTF
jgi:predicted phage terminase large subunit-like protein